MTLLLRVFLIGLIIYLLVRSFFLYGKDENDYDIKTKSNIVNNNERFNSLNIESIDWN